MPITVDLSELRANLNSWPRPMVIQESASVPGTSSPTSSPGSTATNTSDGTGTERTVISSFTMNTEIYTIKYLLEAKFYEVSKSKPISTTSQELEIIPQKPHVCAIAFESNENSGINKIRRRNSMIGFQ